MGEKLRVDFDRWVSYLTLDAGEIVHYRLPGSSIAIDLDLRDYAQQELYYCGRYQPQIADIIARHLDPRRAFLDLGAHIGQHTLLAAEIYRRLNSRLAPAVFAFEPDPLLCDRLRNNIKTNALGSLAVACNVAVSEAGGTAPFYVTSLTNTGTASLVRETPARPRALTAGVIEVAVVALDTFEPLRGVEVGLIKADIEGAELLALRGARHLLTANRPVLVLEAIEALMQPFGYRYAELRQFLIERGYRIQVICSDGRVVADVEGRLPEYMSDLLCLPQ